MSEQEYKAQIEKLRAENAKLMALSQARITVTKAPSKKTGVEYITVKGIPGTGWGLSAEARGWQAFIAQFDTIKAQVTPML